MPHRNEPPQHPVRFDLAMERPTPDEEATIAGLIDTMRSIMEKTYRDGGHAIRGVHAKSHGLLIGEFTVLGDLPPALAQGLFAKELWWIFGDGVNQAADFSSLATSMPSRNVTPLTTFGN